jgi:DNA-directed RNA polymerase specialized sigma24 family protein
MTAYHGLLALQDPISDCWSPWSNGHRRQQPRWSLLIELPLKQYSMSYHSSCFAPSLFPDVEWHFALLRSCRDARNVLMSESSQQMRDRLIVTLQALWLNWLRIRHREIRVQHQDLVQDAAEDLIRWIDSRMAKPPTEDEIRAVGFRILQRRVADVFRDKVAHWADIKDSEVEQIDFSTTANPTKAISHAQLIKALVRLLARLRPDDRDLLLGRELGSVTQDPPVSAASRQRLHRLRSQLRESLLQDYQIDIRVWQEE